jgi:hypothetical protein
MKCRVLNNRPLEPEFGEPYPHYRVYSRRSFAIVRFFRRACGVLAIIIFISTAVALYEPETMSRMPLGGWRRFFASDVVLRRYSVHRNPRHRCGRLLAADESTWRTARPISPRAGFAGFSRTFVEVSNDDREVAARPKRQS